MKAKTIAIPLVMTIILSTLGITYAAWTDLVTIRGEAKMGTVTLAFDWEEPAEYNEYHKYPADSPLISGEYLNKNVSEGKALYRDVVTDPHTDKWGYKYLDIEVNNSYPCLHVRTTYKLHNIGSIPVSVYRAVVTGEKISSVTGAEVCKLGQRMVTTKIFYLFEDYNGNGIKDGDEEDVIWCELTNTWPVQIDPCNTEKREFDMHFLQPAQQCHIYKIHVRFDAIQWNKLYEVQ
jgi:hypothetical protein